MVDARRPEVAVVDIRMPPNNTDDGLVAAQEIRRRHPQIGVLVLSHHLEAHYAMRLLEEVPERAGYLLKERVSDVAVLADALRRIGEGECVVDPTIVSRLVARKRARGPLDELTEREREVLALIAEGPLQHGDRRADVPLAEDRRGAHLADLHEARPATRRRTSTAACWRCWPTCARPSRSSRTAWIPRSAPPGSSARVARR